MADQTEITNWFYEYSDDIYHYLVYRTGSSDAEDLLQEVFIRAIKGIELFQGDSSPKTWLISIARNTAVDHFKSKQQKWKHKLIPFHLLHSPAEKDTPDTILQLNEEYKELYRAIQLLKPKYRDVLILRGIQEFSVRETAEAFGWSENKVNITFLRAKKALQKVMQGGKESE
ncbi:RNA polymerase sigma factor [Evansella clarkii]|uniref:RNA polymerase sigma factor n=1 Tax=Evansella clarkii TaxID=79879 RepID=UPI000B445315|nr:RNA polymerase sigma factor [Evansella clarkii]